MLRRAFGDPSVIESRDGGYALAVEPSEVDAIAALTVVSTATALLEAEDHRRAADLCGVTLALYRGLAFVVLGDQAVADFPRAWTTWAIGSLGDSGIPNAVVPLLVLFAVTAVLLHATPFGRSVYAIGANEEASYFAGLRVKRIKLILFVLSGTIAALAGIVISLRNSTAAANVSQGFELTTITAVLLGGVSIFGGRGTLIGVALALFLLGAIQKALLLSDSISS